VYTIISNIKEDPCLLHTFFPFEGKGVVVDVWRINYKYHDLKHHNIYYSHPTMKTDVHETNATFFLTFHFHVFNMSNHRFNTQLIMLLNYKWW
jgi:hypothetical protein